MKKLRVMVLMHTDLVPPDSIRGVPKQERENWRTEYHVVKTLGEMGHEVLKVGVTEELLPIRKAIEEWQPDIAFNLLEEFHGEAVFDQHVVSYLELMRVPYTGCNPRGLTLSKDKAVTKKILMYHRIPVPGFFVVPMGASAHRPKRLRYPLIVKSLWEEASLGIAQASVVDDDSKLSERVRFIHDKIHTDALVEQYVPGRELYVGVLGTARLRTFPAREMLFTKKEGNDTPIATRRVKWDEAYQKRHGIKWRNAKIPEETQTRVAKLCKRVYRRLGLSGYARVDIRMTPEGRIYIIEANPNPNIAWDDEVANAAKVAGMPYRQLLQRILNIGLRDARRRGDIA